MYLMSLPALAIGALTALVMLAELTNPPACKLSQNASENAVLQKCLDHKRNNQ